MNGVGRERGKEDGNEWRGGVRYIGKQSGGRVKTLL